MLIWLLCSLITVLVMIQIERRNGKEPDEFTGNDWFWTVLLSTFFPIYHAIQIAGSVSRNKEDIRSFLTQHVTFNFGGK